MFNLMNPSGYMGGINSHKDRLVDLEKFGSNPGALKAKTYIPEGLPSDAPLVVVLHGSDQTAEEYNVGAGWSDIADLYGVALLFPEQQRMNNLMLGFNWFEPADCHRGAGEPLSILNMIEKVTGDHGIDRQRIYITGLSSGGAIIAGLPYGSAGTLPAALLRMKGLGSPTAQQLETRLRDASEHEGPWPTLSVWHGSGDHTVNSSNAKAILRQWRALHDLNQTPSSIHTVSGYPRRAWSDTEGRELIEEFSITGMDHGTPLKTHGENSFGSSGDYMLEVNISSTHHIADFWELSAA